MEKTILVIGATGTLGKPVAKQLLLEGFKVRILSRDTGKAKNRLNGSYDFVEGDVRNYNSLTVATKDCHGVHISLNSTTFDELEEIEHQGTLNIVSAALQNKLQKITLISGLGVKEKNSRFHYIKTKLKIENAVKDSGIPYTIFACTHFMDSLPKYIQGDKALVLGKQVHKFHWVAASDFAKMVARAYHSNEADNKKIPVLGPEAYTMEEALTKYCTVNCPNIAVAKISLVTLSLMASISFNKKLIFIMRLMRYFSKTPEDISPDEADHQLGRPVTTLDQWLQSEH